MVQFSAHHVSSRGLKYALDKSAFGPNEVELKKYQKALLNVLKAQEFDSIPLVGSFNGPIKSIGRRRLHDGDVSDVFILTPEEVSKMPQTSPVIHCIFEVLSNEHHIVFLTDKNEKIQDVVTIGMLTNPIIKDYLTLLIGRLHSEGWNFNKDHLDPDTVFDYEYPLVIHKELITLANMVDNPEKSIPSDLEVSTQIVHILSLLQPLKTWDGGPESEAMNSIDYPLNIPTPEYKPGTAGYFAQHPFGAVMENTEDEGVQELAFKMFAEANNWDHLVLKTSSGDYSHLLGKDQLKLEMEDPVAEDTELEEIVNLFDAQNRPLQVNYKHSPYPGIITPQDVVFSEHTKARMARQFLNLEINVRNTYLHHLATSKTPSRLNYFINKDMVWRAQIGEVFDRLRVQLPRETKQIKNKFTEIFRLRNAMAHNDFAIKPDAEIDPQKTHKYIIFLREESPVVKTFISVCEHITTLQYTEFAQIFHTEFKLMNRDMAPEERLNTGAFEKGFVHLTSRDGVFQFHFNNGDVVSHAKKVKLILAERNFPWKCEIIDVKAAALDRAKKELIPVLKARIHEMLKSKFNEQTEFSFDEFKYKMKPLLREVRDTFSLTNAEVISITKLTKKAYAISNPDILNWCEFDYSYSKRTADDGKETAYVKIKNFIDNEEE